jgi:hypothetical protein
VTLERRHEPRGEIVGPRLGARRDDEVDVDLEVARADRRLDAVAVSSGVRKRLRDGRLARAEEPKSAQLGRLCQREHALDRLGLERSRPQPLELAGRPRQDDDHALAALEHEPGRGSREAKRQGSVGDGRLLPDARLEVDVRTTQALRKTARDPFDLTVQALVHMEPDSGCAGDELDGPIVVRWAEAARDDAEIGGGGLDERRGELLLGVAHDHDPRGVEPEPQELGSEERSVEVAPVAADELAAGDDDHRPRRGVHVVHRRSVLGREALAQTAGRMPRGVTSSVLTPPTGSRRERSFRIVRRFSGRSSVSQSFLAVKT